MKKDDCPENNSYLSFEEDYENDNLDLDDEQKHNISDMIDDAFTSIFKTWSDVAYIGLLTIIAIILAQIASKL